MRKIQLGIPITITKVGTSAVRTVISYPNNPKIPKDHITPIITIISEMIVALNYLKKKKKSKDVINKAAPINKPISSIIVLAFNVLI